MTPQTAPYYRAVAVCIVAGLTSIVVSILAIVGIINLLTEEAPTGIEATPTITPEVALMCLAARVIIPGPNPNMYVEVEAQMCGSDFNLEITGDPRVVDSTEEVYRGP